MRYLIFSIFIFAGLHAHAGVAECSSSEADAYKIEGLLKRINPFGTWEGTWDGEKAVVVLSKSANGSYSAKASKGSSNYGPLKVKLCEYDTHYALSAFGYEAEMQIITSKKIKVISPFNEDDTIHLTKK